jgi:inhibitor of KinA sporulation pathway (predicted exonuclease)
MGIKLDNLIVVDVEATCWKKNPPPGEEQEVIEVGICLLEVSSGNLLEKESILVKPERSRVSEFCTKLTTLTQAQVDEGVSFAKACALLQDKYIAHQRVWASYGEFDKNIFTKQCQYRQVSYPFSNRHLNVKTLFAVMNGLEREVGMARALALLNLPLEGTHHRGGDDAWNIARILSQLIGKGMGN